MIGSTFIKCNDYINDRKNGIVDSSVNARKYKRMGKKKIVYQINNIQSFNR